MRFKHRIKLFVFIIAVLLVISSGCEYVEPAPPEKIRFGVLLPLSGSLENIGTDSANGIIMATEEINAAGGVSSLNGALLEPVFADTEGNPKIGAEIAEKLITEEKVTAFIGAYQSSVTELCTQVAERQQIPFIVDMAFSDIITERGFDYIFRICPKASFYGLEQAKFLSEFKEKTGYDVKTVALLYENTGFGTSVAMAQKENLKKYGVEVVSDVSYRAEGAVNLDEEVKKVLNADPDAILVATYLNDSILIRQAQVEQGKTNIPLIDASGGTTFHEYYDALGLDADGTISTSEFSLYTEQGKNLNKRFNARFGTNITGNSAYTYQSVLVLKDALERAGSTDKEKLRDALSKTDLKAGTEMILPAERLSFDADGQNEYPSICIIQMQNGAFMPVWPDEFAETEIILENA